MARDTSPQCKQCRREGQKLFLKGERCLTDKCGVERRSYPPGEHGRGRMRASEYRNQLREKQKARRYYQVLEKQFRSLLRQGLAAGRRHRREPAAAARAPLRQRPRPARVRRLAPPGPAADPPRPLADQRPPRRHPQLPGQARGRDLDQVRLLRRDDGAGRHRTYLHRAPLAAGRSRRAHREGAASPRAGRDRLAGRGAAHRRAVLQVGATENPPTEGRAMTTLPEFQEPNDLSRGQRRDQRLVRDRAPRQGLRLHLRQQPAPRAALVARRAPRSSRVRIEGVAHEFSNIDGVKEDVTDIILNLKDIVDPHAHRRRRGRGAAGRQRSRRGHRRRHRPAGRRRDPQPRRPDRDAREEDEARDVPDGRPRPRLLARRGQQGRRPADRRDPDRLDLLADPPRRLPASTPPASVSAPTSTSSRWRSRPTARSSPVRRCARPRS